MMHRNIIRFSGTDRDLELLAEGTMWPKEIHVEGEAWVMGEVVGGGSDYTVREYEQLERLSPGQRLIRAVSGSP